VISKITPVLFLIIALCIQCGNKDTSQPTEPFVVECTVTMDGNPCEGVRVDFQYTENTGSKVPGATWHSQIKHTDSDGFVVFEKTSFSRSVGMAYQVRAEHPVKKYWTDFESNGMIISGKKYQHLFQFTSDQ